MRVSNARGAVTLAPTVVLATLALIMLHLIPRLESLAALGFLLAGISLMLRHRRALLTDCRDEMLVLSVPVWCLLSVLWSDAPMLSLRFGVLLLATTLVAMSLARHTAPLGFLRAVTVAYGFAALASLAFGVDRSDGLGFLGIYNSKNALAASASVLLIAAAALVLDRTVARNWRLIGLSAVLIALMLLAWSNSVGSVVSSGAALSAVLAMISMSRMSWQARAITAALAVLVVALAVLVVFANADALAQLFVEVTGRDLTLTGRTDLWAVARELIVERPMLGVGFQAFWVRGFPMAEQLWADFGIETRIGFHFHNAILSNAVEIGLPAALFHSGIVLWATVVLVGRAITCRTAETLFLAAFMIRQLIFSLVEVPFFTQFDLGTFLTIAAVVYAGRYRQSARQAPQ